MRRCIFFVFCVFFFLPSCSPKHYIGERTGRAFQQSVLADSSSVSRWLQATVSQLVSESMEKVEHTESEEVREIYSEPDSTGAQYVLQRDVIRHSSQTQITSGRTEDVRTETAESSDSLALHNSVTIGEEMTAESAELVRKRPLPWWMFAGMLAAVGASLFFLIRRYKI